MRIGVYVDLRNPAPWRVPWVDHYAQTLDRICWAEELGAGSVWLSEHHFFEDGYLPQPLTFAAAIAARTTQLRIGTGVLLAPLRHPVHIAEEAALVDLLSAGRVELGFGAGYVPGEFDAFGATLDGRFARAEEIVAEVQRLLRTGGVTPPPAQGEIPCWLGYQSEAGARRAGLLGLGLLSLDRKLLGFYQAGLVSGGYSADHARMGGLLEVIVADDPEAVLDRLLPHYAHQLNSYRRAAAGPGKAPRDIGLEELRTGSSGSRRLPGLAVLSPPDAIALANRRLAALPVKHVYFWLSVAGMPSDVVDRHLELLFGEVAPTLAREETGAHV